MDRKEILQQIAAIPELVAKIKKAEKRPFSNCKTIVLQQYLYEYLNTEKAKKKSASECIVVNIVNNDDSACENAILSLLITLEQEGVLEGLLNKIR